MSKLAINSETLKGIADAIRAKTGKIGLITPTDMPAEIRNLNTGTPPETADALIDKSITQFTSDTLTKAGVTSFYYCDKLSSINTPNLEIIEGGSFQYCKALTEVNFPKVTDLGDEAFSYCTALERADFSNLVTIGFGAFANCSKLWVLILRSEKPCELLDAAAFADTPIENGLGVIFVPAALVDEYKTLSNWETYTEKIFAIEDYPEITG